MRAYTVPLGKGVPRRRAGRHLPPDRVFIGADSATLRCRSFTQFACIAASSGATRVGAGFASTAAAHDAASP